jgi:hypothetical protein
MFLFITKDKPRKFNVNRIAKVQKLSLNFNFFLFLSIKNYFPLLFNFLLGVSPRCARGRRPATSPRAQAVGTQGDKKSLQARFFAAASPAASALAGFPPKRLTQGSYPITTLFIEKNLVAG